MGSSARLSRGRLGVALTAIGLLLVAGCGHNGAPPKTAGVPNVDTSQCGTKKGAKATGTPIPLGAIATNQPGTSFTDIPNMAAAYFACVNANGGINGHPVKLYIETEQTKPDQVAAVARKLVETDKVVGIVGSSSVIECSINHTYWEKQGFYAVGAGIAPECWSTSHMASVNMGPRYSSDGAVQYALTKKPSKIVFDQSSVPGNGYVAAGPAALAKAAHVPFSPFTENVPISDANSVAIKLTDAAGPKGAVVLNFTPPQALVILQAAQKLGLEDKVQSWGCSTPCNTDFLAKELGPKWNHKLFVNAELTPAGASSPKLNLYKAILAKYGKSVSGGIGSFSEMGFTDAEIMVNALQQVKGDYTVKSVNEAVKNVKDFDTGTLCKPWTFGDYPMHIPNNTDYTVTPENGKMVTAQGCTPVSSVDPQIAAYRKVAE